jgi:hypothetical protein
MKFNWGTGIVIVIILFVIGMSSLVYISVKQKINLVYKDYYPREIAHQTKIDKVNNSLLLKENIKIAYSGDVISINFPSFFKFDEVEGQIQLYRPSDFEKDVYVALKLDQSGVQQISATNLEKGKYIVKVDWTSQGTPYFFEQDIHVK